jgi:hypothetical protein
LSNSFAKQILKIAFADFCKDWSNTDSTVIVNMPHPKGKGNPDDMVLRYLDKAVIDHALKLASNQESILTYDTVRAPFQEGFPVYRGSSFREHDHIHLCVRNPDLLTELFDPEKYH